MVPWIESKAPAVVAVIVFGIVGRAVIFVVAAIEHKPETAAHLQASSPVMLTSLSVVAALLIAFPDPEWLARRDRRHGAQVYQGACLIASRRQTGHGR